MGAERRVELLGVPRVRDWVFVFVFFLANRRKEQKVGAVVAQATALPLGCGKEVGRTRGRWRQDLRFNPDFLCEASL